MRKNHNRTNNGPAKPALFLDRDGVINKDFGYVHSKKNFEFMPGIFDLVSTANKAGYLCVVLTNQSGIGRGLYSKQEFQELSTWMCQQFSARDAFIDAIYYSPFHPTKAKGEYLLKEDTRKPGMGMFKEAIIDLNIDVSRSIMVGDNISDMRASLSANIKSSYLICPSIDLEIKKDIEAEINVISNFLPIITLLNS
tara:strand:- start:39792 stop:40379 length:588 start_codon:yes stop_codon:yes gene_type:complete